MLHIKSAKYLSGYKLWIAFDGGTVGEVDLTNELKGSMFEPFKDLAEFQNGADLVPEFLKALRSKLPCT